MSALSSSSLSLLSLPLSFWQLLSWPVLILYFLTSQKIRIIYTYFVALAGGNCSIRFTGAWSEGDGRADERLGSITRCRGRWIRPRIPLPVRGTSRDEPDGAVPRSGMLIFTNFQFVSLYYYHYRPQGNVTFFESVCHYVHWGRGDVPSCLVPCFLQVSVVWSHVPSRGGVCLQRSGFGPPRSDT